MCGNDRFYNGLVLSDSRQFRIVNVGETAANGAPVRESSVRFWKYDLSGICVKRVPTERKIDYRRRYRGKFSYPGRRKSARASDSPDGLDELGSTTLVRRND